MIFVQFIAHGLIIVLTVLVMLANWWYAFGLWPVSWPAFIICSLATIVLAGLSAAVTAAGKNS